MTIFCIRRPDDFHIHLRDGAALATTVPHAAAAVRRALVMPNLTPPILTVEDAQAYYNRILAAVPKNAEFQPLMSLYLTDATTPKMIAHAAASDIVYAVKLYPAHATTNSAHGVTDLAKLSSVFALLEETQLPLLIHGEVTDPEIDIFDREQVFIERHLIQLFDRFPKLKVVLEHITTEYAAEFVAHSSYNLAATITAHHLLLNRNDLLVGGIKPHYYCLPILKRQQSQRALLTAATSGNPKFFLGSDSAPHAIDRKESACGCAGIYTAYQMLAYYAEAFAEQDALNRLEDFASRFGAEFYGLPLNPDTVTLTLTPNAIPTTFPFGESTLAPLFGGKILSWRVNDPKK